MPNQLGRTTGRADSSPLTYADYLRSFTPGSESGNTPMSEQAWNALSPSQQWATIGAGFMIDKNDPRYAGLASRVGGEDGRNIIVQGENPNDADFTDPNLIHRGQGYNAFRESSLTPAAQQRANASGLSDKEWAALVATMFGGAALAGGALGGAGAAEASGGLAANIPTDLAVGGSAGGGSAALSELPQILSAQQVAEGAGGLGSLGAAAGGGSSGGLAASIPENLPLTAVNGGASPALADLPSIQAGGAGAGGSSISRAIDALGGPSGIARGAMGLAALGGAASGGSSNGGPTDANSIIEQMARVNRVNQTTPIGSRTWSQDPTTGQWSVADAMSAPEAANFANVQGMNADVTGMARQRLAAMLARPAAQRYDRPLGT